MEGDDKMKIEFSTDGAAFQSEYEDEIANEISTKREITRILKKIAIEVECGAIQGSIMDINGNKIGTWKM